MAVAALNAGQQVALVTDSQLPDVAVAFAEVIADCAAEARECVGWLTLYAATGALVSWRDVVDSKFANEIWLILPFPSAQALARAVQESLRHARGSPWRFVAATSQLTLQAADLSPSEKRAIVAVPI